VRFCRVRVRVRTLTTSRTLWRIVIRLQMIMGAGWAKRALAVHSVSACLEVERQRIKQARKDISVSRSAVVLTLYSN